MKRIVLTIIILLIDFSLFSQKVRLERVDQWKFDHEPIVYIGATFISNNNSIIGLFRDENIAEVTPKGIKQVVGIGEGPNQVLIAALIFRFGDGDEIAVGDLSGRIKIFSRKDDGFTNNKTYWYKSEQLAFSVRDCVFTDNKFFIAGAHYLSQTKESSNVALITVFNEKGKQIKLLLERNWKTNLNYMQMYYYLLKFKKEMLVFMPENEPIVTLISPKSMEVVKQVPLPLPSFYKKMPEDFYTSKTINKPSDPGHILKMLEIFKTGYSRVTDLFFYENWLVVQMRTSVPKLKKYAILLYNADTFKLEHTLFSDDFLLGIKDGKFYCFANGNPGWDGDIDDVVFNIYKLKK